MSLRELGAEARAELGGDAPRQGDYIPRGEPGPTAPPSDAEKLAAEARQWSALPFVAGGILAQALPELRDVYTEAACLTWGERMAPVARKYGWTLGGFELEAALLMATWSLVGPTINAVRKKRAENAKAKPKPESEAAPAAPAAPQGDQADDADAGTGGKFHPDGSPIA